MKQNALLLILALSLVVSPALGQPEAGETLGASNVTAIDSERINSSIPSGAQFTMVNIFQIAEENPIDPKLGYMKKEVISGKNASVNLTMYMPGSHFGAHYHSATDEVDYVVRGQANMTLNGKDYPVKTGDLIYIPPFNIHDFTAVGNETFQLTVLFTPPFGGNDRIYV